MIRLSVAVLIMVILAGAGRNAAGVSLPSEPDLVVLNAHVVTVDDAQPRAQALAVKQGRFVAVGDNAEVEALAQSVERFRSHEGTMHPHPAFGKLDRQKLEQVHAAHAAHHLRFLEPREAST